MFFAECDDFLRSAELVLELDDDTVAGPEGLEVLRRSAHSIKGGSLTLGFSGLGALATALDHYLACVQDGANGPSWTLLREAFAAVRVNLAGLRDGAAKTFGGPADLLMRLESSLAVGAPTAKSIVFRLSATGAAAPVLFDDMVAEVAVLQAPWSVANRECRIEVRSPLADRALLEIIERVAEPGSVSIDEGLCLPAVTPGASAKDEGESLPSAPRMAVCVAFSLASMKFAADAPGIEEIRTGDAVHPPLAGSAFVCGTIEIDGVFVPVIDLQQCLKLGRGKVRASSMQLVSRLAGEAVAVLVDDVEEVLTVAPDAIRPLAGVISHEVPSGVRGQLSQNGKAMWVIDLPRLLEACIGGADAH
nr:chemotaxis protein CheW [Azoarcus taiwanensis]